MKHSSCAPWCRDSNCSADGALTLTFCENDVILGGAAYLEADDRERSAHLRITGKPWMIYRGGGLPQHGIWHENPISRPPRKVELGRHYVA
jgi:hypothetical protein